MSTFTLEPQYLYKLANMPRGFNSRHEISHVCNVPSNTITVDFLGNCLLCDCDGWLPLPVGKVRDFETIDDVFASPAAQMLQQDVSARNFSWCAVDHCGIRNGDRIKKKIDLIINIDESCNLACPSCRRAPIMVNSGSEYESKLRDIDRILQWLDRCDRPIHITMSGNGDPLASHVLRPLVRSWQPRHTQEFTIFTNGLLIRKQLADSPILSSVKYFSISVDAGSAEVYHDVRRPGKWSVLLDNFDFLREIGMNDRTTLNFALQNKNYHDLTNFISLCTQYGFRGSVHQLDDWGTWAHMETAEPDEWTKQNGLFVEHDVLDQSHTNYQSARAVVLSVIDSPNIRFSPALRRRLEI